jgi:hypothetical protein
VVDVFQLPNRIVEFAPRRCYISPFQRSLAVFKLPPYRLDFLLDALLTRDASRGTGRQVTLAHVKLAALTPHDFIFA